jgi:hypothetical protein
MSFGDRRLVDKDIGTNPLPHTPENFAITMGKTEEGERG